MSSIENSEESPKDVSKDLMDGSQDVGTLDKNRQKAEERHSWHPYIQTLTESDIESCINLENAAFPEQERCTREKVRGDLANLYQILLLLDISGCVSQHLIL